MKDTLTALLLVGGVYGAAAGAALVIVAASADGGPGASGESPAASGEGTMIVESSAWSGRDWEWRGPAPPTPPFAMLACRAT